MMYLLLCYSPVAALTPVLSQNQREIRPAPLCIANAHRGQVWYNENLWCVEALQRNECKKSVAAVKVRCAVLRGVPFWAQRQRPGLLLNIQRGDTSHKMQTKIQGGLAVTAAYVSAHAEVNTELAKQDKTDVSQLVIKLCCCFIPFPSSWPREWKTKT